MKTTTANLLLNKGGAPIASTKFDSTNMSKKEIEEEIEKRFKAMLTFTYEEITEE